MLPCPFPAWVPVPTAEAVAPPFVGPDKIVRDAYGEFPNEAETDNFVVKWGDEGAFTADDGAALAALFETAWAAEIDRMGFPPPLGADEWKFNVYVGGTGAPGPDAGAYAGYYAVDPDGFPMVVMNAAAVADGSAGVVAAHEFFHAVQWGTGQYQADADGVWYFEATAMWIEGEVWPDDPDESSLLYALAFAPQLALWEIDGADEASLSTLHPYGAFIFPRYMSEHVGDWTWIRDSWTDPRAAPLPQLTLAARMADAGLDPAAVFADFAAHAALWDYADHDDYVAVLDRTRDDWTDDPDAAEVLARLSGRGTVGSEQGPAGGGYQLVVQEAAAPGTWRWDFTGEDGVPWGVRLVHGSAYGPVYTQVPVDHGVGSVTVQADGGDVWLAVAAWTPDVRTGAWSVTVSGGPDGDSADSTPTLDSGDTSADTGGPAPPASRCGCATLPPAPSFAPLGVLLALRRRPRARSAAVVSPPTAPTPLRTAP